jgi:hypothetical protein
MRKVGRPAKFSQNLILHILWNRLTFREISISWKKVKFRKIETLQNRNFAKLNSGTRLSEYQKAAILLVPIALCPLSTVLCLLFNVHFPLPAHCLLPIVHCPLSLPNAHCLLSTIYCPWLTALCLLPTVHYPLSNGHCLLSTVYCPLFTAHCLCTAHCRKHWAENRAVNSGHRTVSTLQWAVNSWQWAVDSGQWTVGSIQWVVAVKSGSGK